MANVNDIKIFTLQSTPKKCSNALGVLKKSEKKFSYRMNRSRKTVFRKRERSFNTQVQLESKKNEESFCINGLLGPLALTICIVSSFGITIFPLSNVFINPECWYELIFATSFEQLVTAAIVAIEIEAVLIPFNKGKLRVIADVFFCMKLVEMVIFSLLHLIWTVILGLFEPFPFRLDITYYICLMVLAARFYFIISRQTEIDEEFRKKMKAYQFRLSWYAFVNIQLIFGVNEILANTSPNFQWAVCLIIPLTKAVNDFIINKFVCKYASLKNLVPAKFIASIWTNLIYSFFLAITLTHLEEAAGYILLGVNFALNILLCYKIIQMDAKVSMIEDERKKAQSSKEEVLTELVLNEIIEIIVPLAYIGSEIAFSYGPNQLSLGNISGFEIQLKKFNPGALTSVAEMALIDSGSAILSGILLWWFCRINIFQHYCKIIKKYWIFIALMGGMCVSGVSIK